MHGIGRDRDPGLHRRARRRRAADGLAGVGPFPAQVDRGVGPATDGLAVTLTVTNAGTQAGATTCRVTEPTDRIGGTGAIVRQPADRPGGDVTFTSEVTELGHRGPRPRRRCAAVTAVTPRRPPRGARYARARVRARPGGARRRAADGPLRAARADRLQVAPGRRDRGRPPVRGAHHRRDPGRATRATGSSPRRAASTRARRRRGADVGRRPGLGHRSARRHRSTTPTASRSSASRSRLVEAAGRSSGVVHDPTAARDVRGDGRRPGDARRPADPGLGQGQAHATSSSRWRSTAARSRRAPGTSARPSASRARWAPRRSRSPTSATAASTPSSSRAASRPGTSRRPASSPSAAARPSRISPAAPGSSRRTSRASIGVLAAPPAHHGDAARRSSARTRRPIREPAGFDRTQTV